MIVFDLSCDKGHRFEGWFGSSSDYAAQSARGLVKCPKCDSAAVNKAPMAPGVTAKGNRAAAPATGAYGRQVSSGPVAPEVLKAFRALAEAQGKALKNSTWVGDKFAEEARSIHYGEAAEAPIHGKATREEAAELAAEGIAVAPILFPVAPPDELN